MLSYAPNTVNKLERPCSFDLLVSYASLAPAVSTPSSCNLTCINAASRRAGRSGSLPESYLSHLAQQLAVAARNTTACSEAACLSNGARSRTHHCAAAASLGRVTRHLRQRIVRPRHRDQGAAGRQSKSPKHAPSTAPPARVAAWTRPSVRRYTRRAAHI